jgi:hypothetical protein
MIIEETEKAITNPTRLIKIKTFLFRKYLKADFK